MKSVGALAPSSKFLVKKMLDPIDFSRKLRILELGPGTGVVTKQILEKCCSESELVSIELNPEFCERLKEFESDRFTLLQCSAENVQALFQEKSFDYIISGLPLAIFKKESASNIISGCAHTLKPEGKFIQFQYSLASKKLLQRHFNTVNTSLAAVNLPPAVVYTCQK